jgi:hypothetical protein
MLSVFMLNVVMLSVMAPPEDTDFFSLYNKALSVVLEDLVLARMEHLTLPNYD